MNRHITLLIFTLLLLPGCATNNEQDHNNWQFSEPAPNTEENESEPDETPIFEELDCSQLDLDDWESEEFTFVLYRYFACTRRDEENIIFSPAALRLALAELARNLDGAEGQAIAQQLGFSDIDQFYAETQDYRDELLSRQPGPSEAKMGQDLWEYWIEEDDPERLLEAVGIEFFSALCEDLDDCHWHPQNDRWSETFLDEEIPADLEAIDHPLTRAMILRGQWEANPSYTTYFTFDFHVSKDNVVTTRPLSYRLDGEGHTDIGSIYEARLVGGEISLFIIASWSLSLAQLEGALSADQFRIWLDSLHRVGPRSAPQIFLPDFDLRETVNIANPLHLENRLENTTRLAIDDDGINFPEPLELTTDFDNFHFSVDVEHDRRMLDRPFLIVVYDHPTDSILLMGRVSHP